MPFVTTNLKLWAGDPLVQRPPIRDVPLESLAGSLFQVGHLWDQFCSHPFNYCNKFTFGVSKNERKVTESQRWVRKVLVSLSVVFKGGYAFLHTAANKPGRICHCRRDAW